jgi:2-dehydropantoate 2-reductase
MHGRRAFRGYTRYHRRDGRSDQPRKRRIAVNDAATGSIVVAGAGSVGCFVGGLLAAAGRDVTLLARPRVIADIAAHGLHLTSIEGLDRRLPAAAIRATEDPAALAGAACILVAVKSTDTVAMADLIAAHAPQAATVISLQNGVDNVPLLRERLPAHKVLAGMVAFNALSMGAGRFHRATSGDIVLEQDAADTAGKLGVPGLAVRPSGNMPGVQWGKLLLNLNNAINALSNLPLRDQLSQRQWRAILADQIAEALAATRAAGIAPVTQPLPAALLPFTLRLPDGLFRVLAARMLQIDPQARSSMWEDLQQRRRTEIDHLQGAIVRLAMQQGRRAPLSERISALVKSAEAAGQGSPGLQPAQIASDRL